jgi:Ca-activated chloride channel family protein
MKFTRYSKFNGLDVSSLNLGDLMDALSDAVLQSGFDDDYYYTRQRRPQDTSLDALRQAILQALMNQDLLDEQQIAEMLADNDGEYRGSQLEEMLNQIIERLVEEGYLNLKEEPQQQKQKQKGNGRGEVSDPTPRNIKFEVTEKGLDFLGYKTLKTFGQLRQIFRRATRHAATCDGR